MSSGKPVKEWLYIVDLPRSGIDNMRTDTRLLHWVESSRQTRTVIRFYQWSTPTISVGKHQKPRQLGGPSMGIPVVHRPTGGRAVLHYAEVTYAVVSNDSACFPRGSIASTYRVIAHALKDGLLRLGVPTESAVGGRESLPPRQSGGRNPCFLSASRNELLWQGRKIVGSAQRRLKRSFLQHGSIPLQVDYEYMAAALNTDEQVLRYNLISLTEACGRDITFEVACPALKEGFEVCFGVALQRRRRDRFPPLCDFCGGIASE